MTDQELIQKHQTSIDFFTLVWGDPEEASDEERAEARTRNMIKAYQEGRA